MPEPHRTAPLTRAPLAGSDSIPSIQHRVDLTVQRLILPWANRLSQFDALAEVRVTGSGNHIEQAPSPACASLNRPYTSPLTVNSDVDIIVFSPRIANASNFLHFLEDLGNAATEFHRHCGYRPVFFAREAQKNAYKAIAKLQHGDGIIPIHFLYYPTLDLFYAREGRLVTHLLQGSSTLLHQDSPTRKGPHWEDEFEPTTWVSNPFANDPNANAKNKARWDIECALADFVLNFPKQGSLHEVHMEFLKVNFAENIRKCIRNLYPDARGSLAPELIAQSHELAMKLARLADHSIGAVLNGDLNVSRESLLEYGEALLENFLLSGQHCLAFEQAKRENYRLLANSKSSHFSELWAQATRTIARLSEPKEIIVPPYTLVTLPEAPEYATGCPAHIEALLRSLSGGPDYEKASRFQTLRNLICDEDIMHGFKSLHCDVRARAVEYWGRSDAAPEFQDSIINMATSDVAVVRAWAVWALAQRAPANREVAAVVCSRIEDIELFVGLAALEAARNLRDNIDLLVPTLTHLLSLEAPLHQKWYLPKVTQVIKSLGPSALPLLEPLIKRMTDVLSRFSGPLCEIREQILEDLSHTIFVMGPEAVHQLVNTPEDSAITNLNSLSPPALTVILKTRVLKLLSQSALRDLCKKYPDLNDLPLILEIEQWHLSNGPARDRALKEHIESWHLRYDRY
jgi:hypothetical protein